MCTYIHILLCIPTWLWIKNLFRTPPPVLHTALSRPIAACYEPQENLSLSQARRFDYKPVSQTGHPNLLQTQSLGSTAISPIHALPFTSLQIPAPGFQAASCAAGLALQAEAEVPRCDDLPENNEEDSASENERFRVI